MQVVSAKRKMLYIEIPPGLLHEAFFYVIRRPFHQRAVGFVFGDGKQQHIAMSQFIVYPSAQHVIGTAFRKGVAAKLAKFFRIQFLENVCGTFAHYLVAYGNFASNDVGEGIYKHRRTWEVVVGVLYCAMVAAVGVDGRAGVEAHNSPVLFRFFGRKAKLPHDELAGQKAEFAKGVHLEKLGVLYVRRLVDIACPSRNVVLVVG